MARNKFLNIVFTFFLVVSFIGQTTTPVSAQDQNPPPTPAPTTGSPNGGNTHGIVSPAQRQDAVVRAAQARAAAAASSVSGEALTPPPAVMNPGGTPDYFGMVPNYANSPLPASIAISGDGLGASALAVLDASGGIGSVTVVSGGTGYTDLGTTISAVGGGGSGALFNPVIDPLTGAITSVNVVSPGSGYNTVPGIRKFVDTLPGLGAGAANDLGQYIPVAVSDTGAYPGSGTFGTPGYVPAADYYEIAVVQYTEQLHKDLPPTLLRGYVQIETLNVKGAHIAIQCGAGSTLYEVAAPQYLGPIIVAGSYDPTKQAGVLGNGKPTRVKFHNCLPAGTGGDLFIPVDTTVMGAGMGPTGAMYTQNRATLHLHGGNTPWISDGTPDQWTTPADDSTTAYPEGVSVYNVPDMDGGVEPAGTLTFYYTNEQSARLMFYHDHSYGITRLNVYAGEAAGYLVTDPVEQTLIKGGTIPGTNTVVPAGTIPATQVPLIIQDKTFVPSQSQLAVEDPTWNWGSTPGTVNVGDLWFPHVYMPNQNPFDLMGVNAMGRWDYGPWFWPPFVNLTHGPVPNPLYQVSSNPLEGPVNPGTLNPSLVPEGFMDTPLINGTAYPVLKVTRQAYRFRILNASNDRTLNLQLYCAKSNGTMWSSLGTLLDANAGEVNMVPAVPNAGLPSRWPTDGRDGGVPDPLAAGPAFIQIGTEGGLMPAPAVLPQTPVGYIYNRRDITVLNVSNKTLMLGPAERADVIVDFSQVPTTCTNMILYNDAPAPVPAFDPRNDYYTGDPDQTSSGGAPTTLPGYGPNTRTIMQIQLSGTAAPAYNLAALQAALPVAFAASQPAPIVPNAVYDAAYGATFPADSYVRISDTTMTFTPTNSTSINQITVTSDGTGYTSAPFVSLVGGSGTGATAVAIFTHPLASIAVTSGGSGYITPGVAIIDPTGKGATATATVGAGGAITAVAISNPGSGYSAPVIEFTGDGSGAVANAVLSATTHLSVLITNGGTGYTGAGLPTVVFSGGGTGAAATATVAITMDLQPKAIQELFTTDYGRMNATLGVEIPNTTGINQTTIPLGYIDPATEIVKSSNPMTAIGTLADGTQIWKITHNGVDTHAIHFHMFNVELINRVGWDGMVKPPEANEIGWKETVRMNPLEDAIVALRPIVPIVPFLIPNSVRPDDVTMPLTTTRTGVVDPLNNAVSVSNNLINFGWEYVWHCHLLGHEENDMMRPIIIAVAPEVPSGLTANLNLNGNDVDLAWNDNSLNATSFIVQRATDPAFTLNLKQFPVTKVTGVPQAYTDTTAGESPTPILYYYRVLAANTVGGSSGAYPNDTALSAPSTTVKIPTNLYTLTVISLHGTVNIAPLQPSYLAGVSVTLTSATVDAGWTFTGWSGGTCTGTLPCTFSMPAADVTVTANYAPTLPVISGNAGIGGASLKFVDSTTTTTITAGSTGAYSFTAPTSPWTGTVTPSLTGYTFTPTSRTYTAISVDQTGQNYTATPITYTISGNVNVTGVTLTYLDGVMKAVNNDALGNYSITVPYNWSGTVTPSKTGYSFTPINRVYALVLSNQTAQNYVAAVQSFLLTVVKAGTGTGTVTSSPAGISCGATCSHSYPFNTVVTLTAAVVGRSTFTGWSGGGCVGTGSCIIKVTAAASVTATFAMMPPAAFGKASPVNGAAAQATNLTLSWNASTGAASYQYCIDTINNNLCDTGWVSTGTSRTATMSVPLAGSTIYYWQVQALNAGGTTIANAGTWWHFTTRSCYTLTKAVFPLSSGNVTVDLAPNCAGGMYSSGTTVHLTATASAGYKFFNWTGTTTSTTNPLTVTMNANKTYTANFLTCYTLSTSVNPVGTGSVAASPAPNCAGGMYTSGTVVRLTATPASGYLISSWSGAVVSATNPVSLTVNASLSETANFVVQPPAPFGKASPVNGAAAQATNLTLSWNASARATSYQYCIDTINNNLCDTGWVSTGTSRTATMSIPLAGSTIYYWQVQALNAGGTTIANAGTWWHFTTHSCYTLTPSVAPLGAGSVSVDLAPNCAGGMYYWGTTVHLRATPNSPFTFFNWTGTTTSTTNPLTVVMNANKSYIANFH